MKKILLFIVLLPLMTSAQIGQIQTHEKPGEFIWNCVYHDKPSDTYYLHAQSDNKFEDKTLKLKIGDNSTDAAKSLANFLAAFGNAGTQFEIDDCTFIVATSGNFIRVLNRGRLEYTAGNYYIQKKDVHEAIIFLINSRGADVGAGYVYADDLRKGKMHVWLKDYAINVFLNCKSNLKPYMSRKYKDGEVMDASDVCSLADAIERGEVLRSPFITGICSDILKQ